MSIILGIKKFHKFIHGRRLLLQTDHRPLISILGSKKRIPAHTANRLQRWDTILLNYDFQMEYVPSKKFGHADGLSMLIPKYSEPLENTVITAVKTENKIKVLVNIVRELPVTTEGIKVKSETDNFIKKMKGQVRFREENRVYLPGCNYYSICNGILMYAERVVVLLSLQKRILSEFHKGHPGMTRMKSLMRSYVFWLGMDKNKNGE